MNTIVFNIMVFSFFFIASTYLLLLVDIRHYLQSLVKIEISKMTDEEVKQFNKKWRKSK